MVISPSSSRPGTCSLPKSIVFQNKSWTAPKPRVSFDDQRYCLITGRQKGSAHQVPYQEAIILI